MLWNCDQTPFPICAGDEITRILDIALFAMYQQQPLCGYTKTDLLGFQTAGKDHPTAAKYPLFITTI